MALHRTGKTSRSGQALVEYVMTVAVLTAMLTVCAVFLYTFKSYGGRVLDLVASEYP